MSLDRRRFLQVTALGVVAALVEPACADDRSNAMDRPHLIDLLGPERVRELGNHYRATTPSENTAAALRAVISKRPASRFPLLASRPAQIRDDFEAGRVVLIDGWVLSITEARQAALFSLTPA
jgi:hypothetical protein